MKKPIVLVDVDGVLADFVGGYLRLLKEHTGIEADRDQITKFDIGASLGLSAEQSSRMKRAIGGAPRFALTLDVCPGAQDGIRMLEQVAEVHIATSPWNSNPTWTHDREMWLKKHFDIAHADVTHTSAKHLLRGDFLVDDKTETLRKFLNVNGRGAVQWQTPHNRNDGWLGAATNRWAELTEYVERNHGRHMIRSRMVPHV
jgi:5'(3')-deoxyribonucleotidase